MVRRTEKRQRRRARRTAIIRRNTLNSDCYKKRGAPANSLTYRAPTDFSFIYNPQGTISFFSRILSDVTQEKNFGKKIYFDISQIETLTTDALMYLIAIVTNLKRHVMNQYQIYGNRPRASSPRSLFETSGFYRYVEHPQEKDIIPVCENVQILSGEDADPKSAKKLVDFVLEKGQLEKKQCKFLYNMMMELMSNTKNHFSISETLRLFASIHCGSRAGKTPDTAFSAVRIHHIIRPVLPEL